MATMFRWTFVGFVAGIALIGVHFAIGQGKPGGPPPPRVDGWSVTGEYSGNWPYLSFSVSVKNVGKTTRPTNMTAKLIRRQFKGDRMARVIRDKDIVEKTLETRRIIANLEPGSSNAMTVMFKTKAENKDRVSYYLSIEREGKKIGRIDARPPRPKIGSSGSE